jgi:sigma-E factor negative regulatory protein RseC
MSSQEKIKHQGKVISVEKSTAKVLILSQSACSSCHARGACTIIDLQEKIIDVEIGNNVQFELNENVNVVMKQSYGNKAVLYGYFLPFLFVFLVLILALNITGDEALSGLLSLAVLIPYYIVLYVFKEKLKSKFRFHLEKLQE